MNETDLRGGEALGLWLIAIFTGVILFWPTVVVGILLRIGTVKTTGAALFGGMLGVGVIMALRLVCTASFRVRMAAKSRGNSDGVHSRTSIEKNVAHAP